MAWCIFVIIEDKSWLPKFVVTGDEIIHDDFVRGRCARHVFDSDSNGFCFSG
jgi:hypothetical protein